MNDLSMAFAGPPGPGLTTEQQSQLDALPDWVADIETAVRQNAPNAGELLPEVKGLNLAVPLAVTGVAAIADEDGAPIGFTIAANQSGGAAALFGYPLHDNRTIRDLKGQTVYLLARYWATANFLTLKPLSPLYVDVGRYQGDNQGAPVYEGQVGNDLTRIVKYTVQGDEDCLGIIAQVLPGAAPTVTPMTLRLKSLTYLVEGDVAATINKAIGGFAAGRFGASIIAEVQQASGVLAGAATFLRNANTNYINGLRTPAGANGAGSSVSPYWLLQTDDFPLIQGARARVTIISKLSVPFDRKIDIYASGHIRAVGGGFLDEYRMLSDRYEDGYRIRTIEGIFDAGTEQVTINFNDVSTTVAAAAQQFQADDILIEIIETANGQMSGAQATMALQRNILSRNPRRPMGPEISVAPSGGDFTSCFAAIANIVAGQPINLQSARYEYTGSTLVTRPFFPTFEGLVVRGVGAEMPVISLTQPNNTAPLATSDPNVASIEGNSAADLHFGLELDWVAFEIENGRYAIHIDASNLYYDQHMKLGHVRATHRGNEKAKAYQQSIGNDPAIVWKNCAAVGIGLGSGGVLEIERLDAFGYKSTAVIAHNWNATKAPMRLVIKTGIMDPRDPTGLSDSFYYANSGSLHNDLIDLGDVVMPAPLCFGSSPWMPIDPALCPANKMTFTAIGRGKNVVYRLEDDGSRALRITSATIGASSSIAVSGAGADQTMGPAAKRTTVAGAAGVAGSVTGWIDVGDHKIGPGSDLDIVRLGKRITTGSPLSVVVDGGAPINISLTGNLSQADTLAAIQAALGSAAIVELVNLNDLFRPLFAHEETRVYNAGTTTMKRKHAVAWSGTGKPSARVMTPADRVDDFAGIVYGRDIPPGEWGRVKIGGQVRVSMDIARSDGVAIKAGDILAVSTNDGKVAVGSGPGIFVAINDKDVQVGTAAAAPSYLLSNTSLEEAFRAALWQFQGDMAVSGETPVVATESGYILVSSVPKDPDELAFRTSMWTFAGDLGAGDTAPIVASESGLILLSATSSSVAANAPPEIEIVTDDGQSNSVGQAGTDRAVVYGNALRQDILTLCRGTEANQWTGNPLSGVAPQLDGASITAIGPLLPQIGSTDTHGTGAAEACVRSLLRASEKSFAIWCDGVGGQPIENLLPNPPEGYAFANYVTRLTRAQALKAPETRLVHRYSLTAHGETGAGDADLGGKHEQLRAAMEVQARAILGQTEVLRMISTQPSSFTVATGGVGARSILQYALDHRDDALLICGGPTYHLTWSEDFLHNGSLGQAMRGEAGAGIIRRVEAEGFYLPLHLLSAEVSGANEITALLSEPALLDQTDSLVAIIANAGVTLVDGTVGNVVVNGDQLIITTTSEAASAGGVDLALSGHANGSSRMAATIPRSNIRARRLLGTYSWGGPIKAWACHQSLTL